MHKISAVLKPTCFVFLISDNVYLDLHSGLRSKDLGVMMTSGLRNGRAICR